MNQYKYKFAKEELEKRKKGKFDKNPRIRVKGIRACAHLSDSALKKVELQLSRKIASFPDSASSYTPKHVKIFEHYNNVIAEMEKRGMAVIVT